jgi:hypothetical protein
MVSSASTRSSPSIGSRMAPGKSGRMIWPICSVRSSWELQKLQALQTTLPTRPHPVRNLTHGITAGKMWSKKRMSELDRHPTFHGRDAWHETVQGCTKPSSAREPLRLLREPRFIACRLPSTVVSAASRCVPIVRQVWNPAFDQATQQPSASGNVDSVCRHEPGKPTGLLGLEIAGAALSAEIPSTAQPR